MQTKSQTMPSPPTVLWLPAIALAAVYGAITLSWIIYRVHLPGLVSQFGFTPDFAPKLLLVETLLAIVIEPLAGKISDQTQQQHGSRFPIITLGVILTSVFFVAVPALVTFISPTELTRWLLPLLLLAWAIAISLFRVPTIAFLGRYAPPHHWPQVASLLTVGLGLASLATPFGSQFILNLGVPTAFTFGAILLLGTIAAFRSANPPDRPFTPLSPANDSSNFSRLARIVIVGFGVTLAFRVAIETLPKVLKAQLPEATPPSFIGLLFVTLAVTAIPTGLLAVRIGNRRALLLGTVLMAVFLGLLSFMHSSFTAMSTAIGLGLAFGLLANGVFPFALSLAKPGQAGLNIGLFFAGLAAATSLFSGVLSKQAGLSPLGLSAIGIIGLLAAGWCIASTPSDSAPTR